MLKNRNYEEELSSLKNRAQDLPTCQMSDSMEEGLQETLARAYEAKAEELGVELDDVEKAKGLTIRVMSHIVKKHTVRDLVSVLVST